MEQSDVSGSSIQRDSRPSRRHASITAWIPADQLDSFLQVVEDQANATERSETTTDVTLQYSDLESRKRTLTTEQERIWGFWKRPIPWKLSSHWRSGCRRSGTSWSPWNPS